MTTDQTEDRLLTPAEVAALFRVYPGTVNRWARAGKLRGMRTLGGHRRYRESAVRALLADQPAGALDCPETWPSPTAGTIACGLAAGHPGPCTDGDVKWRTDRRVVL